MPLPSYRPLRNHRPSTKTSSSSSKYVRFIRHLIGRSWHEESQPESIARHKFCTGEPLLCFLPQRTLILMLNRQQINKALMLLSPPPMTAPSRCNTRLSQLVPETVHLMARSTAKNASTWQPSAIGRKGLPSRHLPVRHQRVVKFAFPRINAVPTSLGVLRHAEASRSRATLPDS